MLGAWPSVAAPTACLFVVILGEAVGLHFLFTGLVLAAIWFGSFRILIKTQFSRRQSNRDLSTAFIQSLILGTILFVCIGVGLAFVGSVFGLK